MKQDLDEFAAQAAEASAVLKSLAHEGRLRLLCYLAKAGELSAGELTERVGLSQSAASQHLARLRFEGFVDTRKEAQSVYYRIAEPKLIELLSALHTIYCPALLAGDSKE
ncbi:ArsR/SmtB family transcription factor [Sphingomonas edaphi]|uniref:ArsR family transcriptional regulator n=1 Tax=Sphingomonas edaphi TaxID=2315689 RepID=A0A418Q0E5_9SPHN|nr:metalloregulator ArsR/SmtB family transcription factor [Sphingomonas edaphi]RIX31466.1 ArsR family transcriptional regulator [Sphingomonas edaphi]